MRNIIAAFPSPISVNVILENTEELKKETNCVSNYFQGNYKNNNEYRLLEKYPRIKKILLNQFKQVAKENFDYTNDFIISTSWITKMEKKGEIVQSHCHKNSFYSGVYYFDEYEEDEGGVLEIMTPLSNHFDFNVMPEDWNVYTGRALKFSPKKNLLILFPSYLFHQVLSYEGTSIRKSLAFNIVPIGFYGDGDSSYNTRWTYG